MCSFQLNFIHIFQYFISGIYSVYYARIRIFKCKYCVLMHVIFSPVLSSHLIASFTRILCLFLFSYSVLPAGIVYLSSGRRNGELTSYNASPLNPLLLLLIIACIISEASIVCLLTSGWMKKHILSIWENLVLCTYIVKLFNN